MKCEKCGVETGGKRRPSGVVVPWCADCLDPTWPHCKCGRKLPKRHGRETCYYCWCIGVSERMIAKTQTKLDGLKARLANEIEWRDRGGLMTAEPVTYFFVSTPRVTGCVSVKNGRIVATPPIWVRWLGADWLRFVKWLDHGNGGYEISRMGGDAGKPKP